MNKHSKPAKHQPLHKISRQTKETATPSGPSIDVNGKPVAENDNSENLFEEHIREEENKNQR